MHPTSHLLRRLDVLLRTKVPVLDLGQDTCASEKYPCLREAGPARTLMRCSDASRLGQEESWTQNQQQCCCFSRFTQPVKHTTHLYPAYCEMEVITVIGGD